ncbi:hypothetical protein GCM10011490_27430 [Pseudoclavibacter endophyticus]|nr:hypothetical protein GCM10011490_27430 [Pseudoclavibacter endophyticus]
MRVGEITSDTPVTPENARFITLPLPVLLHIVAAVVFSFLGAFQFVPALRHRAPRWHRFAGRFLVVPSGVIVGVTGIWMTAVYDFPPFDGPWLAVTRHIVGALMLAFLALSVVAVSRRNVFTHGNWMIRAYALGMGAGTQVLTSGPPAILFGAPDEFWRTVQMAAGWAINAVAAELIIAWRKRRRADRQRFNVEIGGAAHSLEPSDARTPARPSDPEPVAPSGRGAPERSAATRTR